MARVACVFEDLMLGSNVVGSLAAAGHDASLAQDASAAARLIPGSKVLVIDLAAERFDGVAIVEAARKRGELAGASVLGVHSHVDQDSKARGLDAGFDLVIPRSRMAREGAAVVSTLADAGVRTGLRVDPASIGEST